MINIYNRNLSATNAVCFVFNEQKRKWWINHWWYYLWMISSALRESWNEENELKLVSTLNKFKYFNCWIFTMRNIYFKLRAQDLIPKFELNSFKRNILIIWFWIQIRIPVSIQFCDFSHKITLNVQTWILKVYY